MRTCGSNFLLLSSLIAGWSLITTGRVPAQTFVTLHSFQSIFATLFPNNNDGANPYAGFVLAGNTLYGTTYKCGSGGNGEVFKINQDGTGFTILHSFTVGTGNYIYTTNSDGANPYAGLILSGNTLYGTATAGGLNGSGTVFAVNTDGTGFTNLHNFTAVADDENYNLTNSDGANPYAGLILSGNTLYGTAHSGGTNGGGTVFKVNIDGMGFTTLYSFTALGADENYNYTNSDGANPEAGLILSGNTLYGTAYGGGTNGAGTVFAVNTDGTGFTIISSFLSERANPVGGLILSGNILYGTATSGGEKGLGTVFAVNTDGAGFTNLCAFDSGHGYPFDGLILSGNTLYGTTQGGGVNSGYGAVFAVRTDGTGFTNLYEFTQDALVNNYGLGINGDGATPFAGLILSGNTLYGTAFGGGTNGNGTLFAVRTNGTGFTNLHTFAAFSLNVTNSDGANPSAGLILSGNTLYGTASGGGFSNGGTVFSINTVGTHFMNLFNFAGYPDGDTPNGVILSGNTLYGTTQVGGDYGVGAVFSVNTSGMDYTNLHSFFGNLYFYGYPHAGVILSGNTLYGTTFQGGSYANVGAVFAVNTDSTDFTNLYLFTSYLDGMNPNAGVILSGNTLYGTTYDYGTNNNGTVFKVDTDGTDFKALHTFAATSGFYTNSSFVVYQTNSDGANPRAGLILSGSTLYGTTFGGGTNGNGIVFSVNTDGNNFTILHVFTAASGLYYTNGDGANPFAGLILSGNTLYGTTEYGGSGGNGTMFAMSTDGKNFTNLHSFTITAGTSGSGFYSSGTNDDGANPEAGLILSGNTLYGTAYHGGTGGEGTVFSLSLDSDSTPQLTITRSGANVIVTWPAGLTGFTLQSTTNLNSAAIWIAVAPAPVIINGSHVVTNSISGTRKFYRLSQ